MQDHETIELVFIAIAALALLTQTLILLAIFMAVKKAAGSIKEEVDDIRSSVMPVMQKTRDMVDRLSPAVEQGVIDLAQMARVLRAQSEAVEDTLADVLDRVRSETSRIDSMFSGTLDAVDKASAYVTGVVSKPVRQISRILASIKAIIESLTVPNHGYREPVIHDDKDMFV
jgi:ABC-type transporter Mla subunit MlaD